MSLSHVQVLPGPAWNLADRPEGEMAEGADQDEGILVPAAHHRFPSLRIDLARIPRPGPNDIGLAMHTRSLVCPA